MIGLLLQSPDAYLGSARLIPANQKFRGLPGQNPRTRTTFPDPPDSTNLLSFPLPSTLSYTPKTARKGLPPSPHTTSTYLTLPNLTLPLPLPLPYLIDLSASFTSILSHSSQLARSTRHSPSLNAHLLSAGETNRLSPATTVAFVTPTPNHLGHNHRPNGRLRASSRRCQKQKTVDGRPQAPSPERAQPATARGPRPSPHPSFRSVDEVRRPPATLSRACSICVATHC